MILRCMVVGCAVIMGVILITPATPIRYNHTTSMPVGFWTTQEPADITDYIRGVIVEACPPLETWALRYLEKGSCPNGYEPLLKPIAAVEGDSVLVNASGISVNGHKLPDSAPMGQDKDGHKLPAYPFGKYGVPFGNVWLVSPHADSLDSRYFGPVSLGDVKAMAKPLWVSR